MSEGPIHSMTPAVALEEGERVIESFRPDRATHWRDHAWLAAGAMALGMVVLWLMGNPHVWTGAVGGLAAIAVRAFYVASDELTARWDLTDRRLLGPQGRAVRLSEIGHGAGAGQRGAGGHGHRRQAPHQVSARPRAHRGTAARGGGESVMQAPKDPRMSGRIAMLALVVLVVLTVVMVRVAG